MPVRDDLSQLDIFDEPCNHKAILDLIKPLHRHLTLERNALQAGELVAMIDGLQDLRKRYRNPVNGRQWGLSHITISSNKMTDLELLRLLEYVSGDCTVEVLDLMENLLELREHVDGILRLLNASSITNLMLTENNRLQSAGINRLFQELRAPRLRVLGFTDCDLGPDVAEAVTACLGHPRCRPLQTLYFNGNAIGMQAVQQIIDTIESRNFTLHRLDMQFGGIPSHHLPSSLYDPSDLGGEWAEAKTQSARLTKCLERNRALSGRVRQAASRCLPIARIILNDMSLMARRRSARQGAQKGGPAGSQAGIGRFRLMELPLDIIDLVVRHTTGDAAALSDAQFAHVRMEAIGRRSLQERVRARRAVKGHTTLNAKVWERKARLEWLERHGLDRWDSEVQ